MNIAVLTLSLKRGGAERITAMLAQHLAASGQGRLLLYDTASFDYPYDGPVIDLGLPEPQGRSFLGRLKNTRLAIRRIKDIKQRGDFDVLLSSLEPANIPNALTAGRSRTRTVLWVHEDKTYVQVRDVQRWITDFLIRRSYRRADLIIAVSRGIRRTLMEKYGLDGEKIKVIYNPIDLEAIRTAAAEPLEGGYADLFQGPVVTTVGRMTVQKGQWHLIRAFKEVLRRVPDARLAILGDGDLKGYLSTLAADLGIADRILFLGYQKNPFRFLARSTLFVLPSLWEGLGYVILESLALGVPVISTDARSGPREILAPDTPIDQTARDIEQGKFGLLVPTPDGQFRPAADPLTREESLMRDAITTLLSDKARREELRRQGPIRAEDFRTDRLLPEYEKRLAATAQPPQPKIC